jgi:hypothetical protein
MTVRQRQGERDLSLISHLPLSLASDASVLPSPVSPQAFRFVVFASASPTTSFWDSLANFDPSAYILHGQIYGTLLTLLTNPSGLL